jgi:hypothetical protein
MWRAVGDRHRLQIVESKTWQDGAKFASTRSINSVKGIASMSAYDDIVTVMNYMGVPSKAIQAKYSLVKPDQVRKLLPVLVGPEPDGSNDPVVLCYQFDPAVDTNHPSKKNWRCFKVNALTEVSPITFATNPKFNSPPFTHKKVDRQSCVDVIEEWRKKPYVQPA